MSAFLAAIVSFPTVFFTVLLGLFLLFALATIAGAADIEWLDGLIGIDDVQDSALEGTLQSLGIAGIPLTIFGGAASAIAWMTSLTIDRFFVDSLLVDGGIGLASALVGIVGGALAVRPLRPVFATIEGPHRDSVVGKICTIRSLAVNDRSGTAEVGDYIAEVRCFRENDLTLGRKAVIYEYDTNNAVYHVAPLEASVGDVDAALQQNARSSESSGLSRPEGSEV